MYKLEIRLVLVVVESQFTAVSIILSPMQGARTHSTHPEPFEDEIHPRLRFAHRGLVAMANNGTKNSNDSQFFVTLGEYICAYSQRVCTCIERD